MTPAQTDRLQLSRGTKTIRTFSVVFPESGFYTVQVVAKQTTPEPIRDWVPESATANAWILVLDTGGRFSAVYDSTMILKDAVSTGPFRHVDPTKNAPPQAGVQAVGGEPQRFCEVDCPPRNCCFGGTLTYSDPVTGQVLPLHGVTVQVRYNTGELFESTAWLGTYGGLSCPNPGEVGHVAFLTLHSAFTVRDHGALGYDFANVSSSACGTNLMAHNTVLPGAIVFAHMMTARDNGTALLGKTRGTIPVDIEDAGNSSYTPSSDRITIATGHVGDQFGGFAQAHEYGHALQAKAFAHGNPGSGLCNGAHEVNLPNTSGCATSEGWADYFSIVVLPTFTFGLSVSDFESNSWVLAFPTQGDLIEGAVAAYYLDMSDAANSSEGDAQTLGPKFVADIISSCTSTQFGPPYWIYYLRACFENSPSSGFQLIPSVSFPSGWTLAAMQQDFAWNISAVR